jgi:aldehyde dehydrogenase (NAD+)
MHTWDRLYIGGEWQAPSSDAVLEMISPATEECMGRVPAADEHDAEAAVLAARRAFDEGPWPRKTVAERAEVILAMGEIMRRREDELADVATRETAMSHAVGPAFAAMTIERWIDVAETIVPRFSFVEPALPHVMGSQMGQGVILREPYGVVTAITPSNIPWFCTALKVAPALAAGCTVVLMPPAINPQSSFILAEIAEEAGLDAGALSVVPGSPEVGRVLTAHPGVDMISFTGSDATARRICEQAAPTMKKVVCELGGKSANIVCEDADLNVVAADVIASFTAHSGQGCSLLTRTLVHESIHDELVRRLLTLLEDVKVGDPSDPAVSVVPLISAAQREKVENLIAIGIDEGAKVLAGGGRPADLPRGFYVEPTLMVDVDNAMTVAQEEFFGPVGVVIPFTDDDHAIRLANESRYGLSGGVWSSDPARAYAIAQQLRTGEVLINGGGPFGNPYLPWGGYKSSGSGREQGHWGLDEYLQYKAVRWPVGSGANVRW